MSRIRGSVALALLAGLACGGAILAETEDLTHYDIRVTLDPAGQTLVGWQRVDYVNDTGGPVGEILFCLLANWGAEPNPYLHPALLDAQYVAGFDPTWTRIHRVADASGRLLAYRFEPFPPAMQTYSLENGFMVVDLASPLAPGDRVTLDIEFETRFSRALLADNCVYRGTYVWRFGWNPIAVAPALRDGAFILPSALYRVELTAPEAYRVFAGADRQGVLGSVAGLTTHELANDRPVRSIPLVIGPDLRAVSSAWDGVTLEAVYLPGGETFARAALSWLAEILADYSARYGRFQYRRLVLVENPAPGFYGMAADGMILVGRSLVELKDMPALGVYDRLIEYLLAHEAAHLWWGIGIGADFNAENWISEGFAEYLSIRHFEDKYGGLVPNLLSHLGGGILEDAIRSEFGYLNLRRHFAELPYLGLLRLGFDEAIVKPLAEAEYLNGETVRIYKKGYLVLRALESLIGREALQAVLAEAGADWHGKTLTVEGFRRLAEDVAAVDLSDFFARWLFGDARLDLSVDGADAVENADGTFATTVSLHCEGVGLPVEVLGTLSDGSTVRRLWHAATPSGTVTLESDAPVVHVLVDPDEMLPDANRFNNHWPRRFLVDHPLRGDKAPEIGVPLDAYYIDISLLGVSGGFRDDHAWTIGAVPHLEDDAAGASLGLSLSTWDAFGQFAADIDRTISLSASVTITALNLADGSGILDAQFTVHTRGFSHPEVGAAGTYWYPAVRLDVTLGARGELPRPIPYVALTLARSDMLALYLDNVATLHVGVPGFGADLFAAVEWTATKRLRLDHLLYVDLTVSAGASLLGTLPTDFMFSMDRLVAFALPPYGDFQILGRVDLVLPPLARDAGYAILNLTRVEDVTAAAFIQGGRTWGGCSRVCESGIRVEAGGTLTLRVDAFLGSVIDLSVGYAHPLLGPDGEGRWFIELGGDV